MPQDYAEAVRWYRKAADQGYATLSATSATCTTRAEECRRTTPRPPAGTAKPPIRETRTLSTSSASCISEGAGVPQDYAEAARWFRRAADQGHARAQFNLGFMYHKARSAAGLRRGRPLVSQSRRPWKADAQEYLAYMYYTGQGVPQDYAEAARWYREAADQGIANAQHSLGVMFHEGQGVPQDYIQAHMWFNLAGAGGDLDGIESRDIVAGKMTPDEIAEAQRRAREWRPETSR